MMIIIINYYDDSLNDSTQTLSLKKCFSNVCLLQPQCLSFVCQKKNHSPAGKMKAFWLEWINNQCVFKNIKQSSLYSQIMLLYTHEKIIWFKDISKISISNLFLNIREQLHV